MHIENPLNLPIQQFLTALDLGAAGELREIALIEHLKLQGLLDQRLTDSQSLYQAHFLVRNSLYQFAQLRPEINWHFSAFGIRWNGYQSAVESSQQYPQLDNGGAELADYYLDMNNLSKDTDEVEALLKGFWQRYAAVSEATSVEVCSALQLLELKAPVNMATIKQQYRRKAMSAHPDRGGSDLQLQQLNAALALLQAFYDGGAG